MRIALFSEVYWPMVSGVGVTLLRLTRALEERGHQVRVYSASYPLPNGQSDRPEVHRSPSVPLFLYPDVQWAFPRLRDVVDDAARFRPDVVHVATEFALGIAGLKVARQLRLPLVASAHTDYDQYAARYGVDWALRAGWRYLRWFYGQGHRVLCPSRIYEEHLHSRGVTNTGIWSRGVDTNCFHPRFRSEAYRRALGVGPGDLLVTYIGRIAREKNLGLLLEAWDAVAPVRGSARLVLVGRGPLEDGDSAARDPGRARGRADGRAGAVDGLRLGRHLRLSLGHRDLRQLAARGDGVGAAVAGRGGGRRARVRPARRNAWLVAPNSAPAIAEGLGRLMEDSALRRCLSEGALQTAGERGWDEVYDQLIGDYQDAIDRRGATQAA